MPPPAADRSPQGRRIAAALLELGADALALAVRAATGHRLRGAAGSRSAPAAVSDAPPTPAPGEDGAAPPPPTSGESDAPPPPTPGEDGAARIDAARERLRSRIAAPSDEIDDGARRFASYDGTALAYRQVGAGPPLICLAGGPGADVRTLGTVGGLDRCRRLILVDARASGVSDVPTDRLSCAYTEQARDLEALRQHLRLERMDLLAHSAGALTAQHYAATSSERVRKLVLVSAAGLIGREVDEDEVALLRARRAGEAWYEAAVEAANRLASGDVDPHERDGLESELAPFRYGVWSAEARQHARDGGVPPPDWLRAAFYAGDPTEAATPARLARLRAVQVPILAVAGAEDCVAGTRPARLIDACYRSTRLEILPGAGHHPWLDAPERFQQLVIDFLAS
ncbi:MAG: hypothetical protein QOJ63_3215 [Solirubrobacteraceae bacterium]|nr:hypothetical protein [Solirubrobacteraceae bacterium]